MSDIKQLAEDHCDRWKFMKTEHLIAKNCFLAGAAARQPEVDALKSELQRVYNLVSHHAQASKAFDWLQSVEFGLSTLADGAYGIAVTTDEGVKFISGSTPIIAVQRAMEQVKL